MSSVNFFYVPLRQKKSERGRQGLFWDIHPQLPVCFQQVSYSVLHPTKLGLIEYAIRFLELDSDENVPIVMNQTTNYYYYQQEQNS